MEGVGHTRQGELCCSELCNLQVENKTYDFLLGFCKWLWACLTWQQCPFSSSCRTAGCSSTPCLEFLKTLSPDTGPLAGFSDGDVLLAARVSVFIVLVHVACPEAGPQSRSLPDCKTSSGVHSWWGIPLAVHGFFNLFLIYVDLPASCSSASEKLTDRSPNPCRLLK